jgi:hypothetical protein
MGTTSSDNRLKSDSLKSDSLKSDSLKSDSLFTDLTVEESEIVSGGWCCYRPVVYYRRVSWCRPRCCWW